MSAAVDQGGFQNLVLRRDRSTLENVRDAVVNSLVRRDRVREIPRLTVGRFDHFAQCPFLEETDLTKLLSAYLIIGGTLEFLRAGLVDDVSDLLLGQFATELRLLTFHGQIPLLRPFREPVNQLRRDALDLEPIGGLPGLVA